MHPGSQRRPTAVEVGFLRQARANAAMFSIHISNSDEDASRHPRGTTCPSFALNFPPSHEAEGAGNTGRAMHPQPRVQNKTKHTSIVTTVTPESPGIPRAMVLTVTSCSPR